MANPAVGRDPEATGAEPQNSFGDILTQFEQAHASQGLARGDGREGTVITVTGESVFVDIGMKIEGIVPAAEFRDKNGAVAVQPGDKLFVSITGRNDEGYYLLSKLKVQRPKDWAGLEKAFQEKRAIAGVVSGVVKGGLNVDIGVRAFMPASRSGAKDAAELEKLVGQEITCKIIKLDVADEDVVVDRRAILEEEEARNREQRLADLKEGATVQGTVRTLTDFGAFVDIGGVDGLLHVTDMAWGRVNKPSDVLTVGDSVEVTTSRGPMTADAFVNCSGAWAAGIQHPELQRPPAAGVEPWKGQIFTVHVEPPLDLAYVLRSPEVYLVPRGGGNIVVGATVEQVGYDRRVDPLTIRRLQAQAAELWPPIASAPVVESWTGLRPGTSDGLPVIGSAGEPRCWVATGHFRNGILLAPATGLIVRQLLQHSQPAVGIEAFAPGRPSK